MLVSGSGTNLQAILDATRASGFGARVVVVISDRPGIPALQRARRAGVPTEVVAWADFPDRAAFSTAVCHAAQVAGARALVLAGFMRVLAPEAVERFPNRILNIHPSLLPAFPGTGAVERAIEHGVKLSGVTVHFVDEQVDHGPIIAQEAVEVLPDDTPTVLHARLQEVEHRLYPEVVRALAEGRLEVQGRRVIWR